MIKLIRVALISAALALPFGSILVTGAVAGAYEDGAAAYDRSDYATALRDFRPLAQAGGAQAQVYLGKMYLNGQGVSKDYEKAMKWWRLAAEQGNADAQNDLGGLYLEGKGVGHRDYVRAYMWFTVAAGGGQNFLANFTAKKMTPAEIEQANAMATKCKKSKYKKCGE